MIQEKADFIRAMEKVGRLAATTLKKAGELVRPGVTPNEINAFVHEFTLSHGAVCAPLNYDGFPKSVCTSVNDVICHGVPDDVPLKEGDIINIDVTTNLNGYFGDTSSVFFVGNVSDEAKKLTEIAFQARLAGIEAIKPGARTGDIGFAIESICKKNKVFPVRELGGHGIGKIFHDEPFVPSFGKPGKGMRLKPFTCITIEPMVNLTGAPILEIDIPDSDVKIYRTSDGRLSSQFEHTILITDRSYEILTIE